MSSGLFGIVHSNREDNEHWGKNCFNSSFPTALACYMLHNSIPAVYVHLVERNGHLVVAADEIPIQDVFNCPNTSTDDLFFAFESIFAPYQDYSFDVIDGIDLVVKDTQGHFLAPLEVKLTVLPTDNTSQKREEEWGCELVIRSATTLYCALGMFDTLKKAGINRADIRGIFEHSCSNIQSWDNDYEMSHKTQNLHHDLLTFQHLHYTKQKPLLMQTIWKTQGKSPLLADNAFDIVIWSDYAFSRLFLDSSSEITEKMSRPQRATARLARCLWELSKSEKIHIAEIYRQMAFGNQTDKEFAINGVRWKKYVQNPRTITPIIPKTAITDIIQDGYIEKLSPERRFDQTLYFTILQH